MIQKIKVHIADDHKILIEGLIALINTEQDIVVDGYSLTGLEVLSWIEVNPVQVILLDISMPLLDGISVLKKLKRKKIKAKVILLSSHDDAAVIKKVLKLGALGYITKGNAKEDLIEGIRAVVDGQQYLSPDVRKLLLQLYSFNKEESSKSESINNEIIESLTEREIEVLKLVANQFNSDEISDLLYISKHTVESYRKSLTRKLKVKNVIGLAMYAVKHKLV